MENIDRREIKDEIEKQQTKEYQKPAGSKYVYLSECTAMQKTIIEMHYFARPPQTFRQIATNLNIPFSKVYREYRRGLKILAEFYRSTDNNGTIPHSGN